MVHSALRRPALLIAALSLTTAACAASNGNADDDRDAIEMESARQDVTEVASPAEAIVVATSTTTTTTTSTTTTSTTTTSTPTTEPPVAEPPVAEEPPDTGNNQSSGNEVAFESGGTEVIGADINAGLYIAQAGTGFCTWDRTDSTSGTEGSISMGQIVVEILASDDSFTSDSDCGTWQPYAAPSEAATTISEGHWVVGDQIVPGTYRTDETVFDFCYWERSTAFTHTTDEIVVNDIVMEEATVTINASDARFVSSGCGTWTLVT